MLKIPLRIASLAALAALQFGVAGETKPKVETTEKAVLWREPADIASRNLFYGPGGEEHAPAGQVTFEKEDMKGTNPKFIVRDEKDVKWTLKLGNEARPETVASRLVWAAGYFTNQDYFASEIRIAELPSHVNRGENLIGHAGTVHNARLKRHEEGKKDVGEWKWREGPFAGTRELNGLRVMMALINNWDLKDENNNIYLDKKKGEQLYVVSDLGASFGATGLTIPFSRSKDDLDKYSHSRFITKTTPDYVDFGEPTRPALIYGFRLISFIQRIEIDSLGRHIRRADAKWMGEVLSRLSPKQIRDAFRAAGYSPEEVEAFSTVVEQRIADLRRL